MRKQRLETFSIISRLHLEQFFNSRQPNSAIHKQTSIISHHHHKYPSPLTNATKSSLTSSESMPTRPATSLRRCVPSSSHRSTMPPSTTVLPPTMPSGASLLARYARGFKPQAWNSVLVRWLARVFSRRYWASDRGVRREIVPVLSLKRSSCSGDAVSVALSAALGVAGSMLGALVRGRRVMVEGRWPPRENVVRWRRRWPWRDLGSRLC